MEKTSSVKLDEMLNFRRAALIKLVSGMITLSSCDTSSSALHNVTFVPLASNAKPEIIVPKIDIVSEDKYDKGKSILGALPKFV